MSKAPEILCVTFLLLIVDETSQCGTNGIQCYSNDTYKLCIAGRPLGELKTCESGKICAENIANYACISQETYDQATNTTTKETTLSTTTTERTPPPITTTTVPSTTTNESTPPPITTATVPPTTTTESTPPPITPTTVPPTTTTESTPPLITTTTVPSTTSTETTPSSTTTENIASASTSSSSITTNSPSVTPPDCSVQPLGRYPASNCYQFYTCYKHLIFWTKLKLITCSSGFAYDPSTEICIPDASCIQ